MSRNPKHAKSRAGTKIYARKHKRFRSMRGIFFTVVILAIIIAGSVAVVVFTQDDIRFVKVGDTVTVKYTLWTTLTNEDWEKSEQRDANNEFYIDMKETAQETGLIYGFWDAVLGMAEGEIDNGVYLEACVDDLQYPPDYVYHQDAVAGDGWDDRYAPELVRCQSYGDDSRGPELRFKRLIFEIEIIKID